jgi:nitrous oxidase accessory protein NosD
MGTVVVVLLLLAVGLHVKFAAPGFSGGVEEIGENPTDAWVDDDDPTCGGNQPCFAVIQLAVHAVQEGGTVHIQPGTYRENIVINRRIALRGVGRELTRIEARDHTKPVILATNTYVNSIHGVGIVTAGIGVQVFLSDVFEISENSITSSSSKGIVLHASSLKSLENNEILAAQIGVETEKDSIVSDISNNTIRARGGILLKSNVFPGITQISGNSIHGTVTGIFLDGQTSVVIERNHIQGFIHGGIVVGDTVDARADILWNEISGSGSGIRLSQGKAVIANNFFIGNKAGILVGSLPFSQKSPKFEVIRNRFAANEAGIVLFEGEGIVIYNSVLDNGFRHGTGLQVGSKVRVQVSHNHITNNARGVIYTGDSTRCDPQAESGFEGEIKGDNNEIRDNELGDLCPADYPWPPGFRK